MNCLSHRTLWTVWTCFVLASAQAFAQQGAGRGFAAAPTPIPADPQHAVAPSPRNDWIVVEGGTYSLRWTPATAAASQELRLAQVSSAADLDAKAARPMKLSATDATVTMPVSNMKAGQTYYWRVDALDKTGKVLAAGEPWSFRVVQKKLRVYLLGGQSNMTGEALVNGLNEEQLKPQKDVMIFMRGQIDASYRGTFGWDYVQPRLGSDRRRFGPELGFAKAMSAAHPGEEIAFIKCAFGGTNMNIQWRPPSSGTVPAAEMTPTPTPRPTATPAAGAPQNAAGRAGRGAGARGGRGGRGRGDTAPGYLYRRFTLAVHDGMAALDPNFEPEIVGMIWMQGEEDSLHPEMAAHYEDNLTNFIHDIRAEVKKPDLPFVIGMVADSPTYAPPEGAGSVVRAAQTAVSKKVPHTAIFDTSDYKRTDPWHYAPAGQLSLGGRFAAGMLKLEAK